MPIPSLSSSLKPRGYNSKSSRDPNSDSLAGGDTNSNSHAVTHAAQILSIPHHSNVDGAKRRSFLPQRGHLKSISRTNGLGEASKQNNDAEHASSRSIDSLDISSSTIASKHAGVQGPTQGRLRPRSMYQPSSARTEQHTDGVGAIVPRSMRPPDAVSASSALQSAGLSINRSQSLRRPSAPTQPAQPANSRAHSRTHSTSTSTTAGVGKQNAETRPQLERPRSLLVVPSHAIKTTNNGPADVAPSGIRTSVRLAALKRSASTRAHPESTESSDIIGAADKTEEPLSTSSRRREPSKEESKKQARPAFSTLQQHFTPRKTGKAPTSTFLHPPAPDTGAFPLSSEFISLQAELLQLHILHVSSAETTRRWELSARRSLHAKFDKVASLYQVTRENERHGQEQKNIQALCEWNSGNSSFALMEHIQVLSGPLHELPSLVDPGGRFTRLVDDFDRWITWVEEVWAPRGENGERQGGDLASVEGLGDAWKVENAALTRKLTAFSRDIDRLTQPAPGSSIARIVATCKELLGGILDELQTMQMIEIGVVAREQEWVEARLKAIARDIESHLVETYGGREAWRE